jgi:hypothetical protein
MTNKSIAAAEKAVSNIEFLGWDNKVVQTAICDILAAIGLDRHDPKRISHLLSAAGTIHEAISESVTALLKEQEDIAVRVNFEITGTMGPTPENSKESLWESIKELERRRLVEVDRREEKA